jgi:hypothetical protein
MSSPVTEDLIQRRQNRRDCARGQVPVAIAPSRGESVVWIVRLRLVVVALAALSSLCTLSACQRESPGKVVVEIVEPADQLMFESVLKKHGIKYEREERGTFLVQAKSIEELKAKTAEYSAWQAARYGALDVSN